VSSLEAPWLRIEGRLATITLDRPDVLNAIDLGWIASLQAALDAVARSPEVCVLVVRGAGRAFCSGLDLDLLARDGMPAELFPAQERAFRALELLDAVTIAAIHGHCVGGGLQLAAACDLRLCSADAVLGLPAVNEGLFPALATYRLPRLIGLGPARRLILSGEPVAPAEALRLGLVDYVVPAERFDVEARAIVDRFVAAPAPAARASKRLMRLAFGPFEEAYEAAEPLVGEVARSADAARARAAWRERRASRAGETPGVGRSD